MNLCEAGLVRRFLKIMSYLGHSIYYPHTGDACLSLSILLMLVRAERLNSPSVWDAIGLVKSSQGFKSNIECNGSFD